MSLLARVRVQRVDPRRGLPCWRAGNFHGYESRSGGRGISVREGGADLASGPTRHRPSLPLLRRPPRRKAGARRANGAASGLGSGVLPFAVRPALSSEPAPVRHGGSPSVACWSQLGGLSRCRLRFAQVVRVGRPRTFSVPARLSFGSDHDRVRGPFSSRCPFGSDRSLCRSTRSWPDRMARLLAGIPRSLGQNNP